MRLVTLNLWECKLPHPLSRLLQAERPDIACLQEATHWPQPGYDWLRPGLEQLAEAAGTAHTCWAPCAELAWMHGRLQYGNVILSRTEPLAHDITWVSGSYDPDFDIAETGQRFPRNYQHAAYPGLHVINYHGDRVRDGHKNGGGNHASALANLAAYASGLEGPVIIAGDFNLWPASPALGPLQDSFRDLVKEAGIRNTRTWLKGRSEVCDYVFASKDVDVRHFRISPFVASDHVALVLDFRQDGA
jgi:endonuclease/exonuclease/phosphatase family metal-dependent hydrolase